MSFLDSLKNRLTDRFKRTALSNTHKLLQVFSGQLDDINETLYKIQEWRDIDKAEGVQLDKLGSEIVQEYRNGQTDEEYRLRIKVKIVANLSKGDIPTVNNVLRMFLGNSFISVQEMWSLQDPIIDSRPASILITTETHTPFPAGIIGRVVAGGIGVYWHIIFEPKKIIIQRKINQGQSDPFLFSGEFYAGSIEDTNTSGTVWPSVTLVVMKHSGGQYDLPVIPGYTAEMTDSALGRTLDQLLDLTQVDTAGSEAFVYAGDDSSSGSVNTQDIQANETNVTVQSPFNYSGEKYAGEE